ncbi:hypothetical protein GPJ56_010387 [Histomonas meleagridis]|uniref:uncharacterized protein n=1 Tax=Histomonas meleagridis TaxID=135588 RepID=UPI003559FC00|nr:hypothetical protein GPJ56_010387 [Histomonas meleagridis]KAH0799055.1 hypothetical protein GO595_008207 [Histomonas meleagridis]
MSEQPKQGLLETPEANSPLCHLNEILAHQEIVNPSFETYINSTTPELNPEKKRINGRLSGFNPKESLVWKEITRRFGVNIKQPELVSIATVLANSAKIKLDRDAKRRKTVLIKWFDENYPLISPYLDYVVLQDPNGNPTN